MIKLLKAIYAVYCLIAFAASFIIVIPCYFIVFNLFSKKKSPFIAHKLSKFWAHLLFVLFFVRCKIENKEHIDPDKQYVFVANHLSMLDIPAYAAACSNSFRFLSKAELAKTAKTELLTAQNKIKRIEDKISSLNQNSNKDLEKLVLKHLTNKYINETIY